MGSIHNMDIRLPDGASALHEPDNSRHADEFRLSEATEFEQFSVVKGETGCCLGNNDTSIKRESTDNGIKKDHFTSMPPELIDRVLIFLEPTELTIISRTCRLLFKHANQDIEWQRHIQANLPGLTLTSSFPFPTYRELYISHDPHWFLPKYKIWFSNYFLTGKIIIIRYCPQRGSIEGYRLVAERGEAIPEPWEVDPNVLIHPFAPNLRLHLDRPVLNLSAWPSSQGLGLGRFRTEVSMPDLGARSNGVFSNFLLTRPVEERPNMDLWPPTTIPSDHRVRNASQEGFVGEGHKPQRRSDISTISFRIRHWMRMMAGPNGPGNHLGEEVHTYSTLDPKLYTPTEDKPYRGIWVGDYSGHGCEFLLFHQPDDEEPFNEASVIQGDDETVQEFQLRKKEERVNRGRLEAIKLTGDPHIPRGEYTFIADDLSQAGFVRTAEEAMFRGARIIKSRGHIAARMFRHDKFIDSHLIMISRDRLAQYWIGFRHISYFQRVNIDTFLSPGDEPIPDIPLGPLLPPVPLVLT